ncbi:unnamed protein product [Allacma fusca]|uniref:Uncharacterized protein n=1 Tax=Allacma fusca TaxID=39272 RepID=A0A8J2PUQ5_9HEXA|nr:unnamed protein product [Allacma fusca]
MLLGLVGFPEIVRRKFLSKKSSPIVQSVITRNKPQDQLQPGSTVLDSTVNSEDSFVELNCNNNYIAEHERFDFILPINDPDCFSLNANRMDQIQVSVSKELLPDTDDTEILTGLPVQKSTSMDRKHNENTQGDGGICHGEGFRHYTRCGGQTSPQHMGDNDGRICRITFLRRKMISRIDK